MHPIPAALLPLLALLGATPVLMPWSHGPIVTALAELWALAVAGIAALVLGVVSWRQAPLQVAAFETPDPRRSAWPDLLIAAAALAGLISAFMGLVQVLLPEALNGALSAWIQPTHLSGRAVAHLRQPNHLATVLLWGAVAWAVLHAQGRIGLALAAGGTVVLMTALAFTGSRTGLLGLVFLWGWALADRQLPRVTRLLLALSPVWAGLIVLALRIVGDDQGAAQHLSGASSGDISSSRFAIWRNTWTLIEQQPWTGVGWGHFNIAWSLTPMTSRPPALFDHAHNLPLHLMAEFGVPIGMLLSGLGLFVLVKAARSSWATPASDPSSGARRGAVVIVAIVALHSLLEYPLWYAYLGLPTLLALIVGLGWDRPWRRAARWQAIIMGTAGTTMIAIAAWAHHDYQTIRAIYEPGPQSGSLSHRIARGQQATWFADHAHYALATTVRPIPRQPWTPALADAFERAPHVLLDARLMMAWADALAARDHESDRDQARHLAARLREFNPPAARDWLQACERPETTAAQRFVCEPPERVWNWRDFGLR